MIHRTRGTNVLPCFGENLTVRGVAIYTGTQDRSVRGVRCPRFTSIGGSAPETRAIPHAKLKQVREAKIGNIFQ